MDNMKKGSFVYWGMVFLLLALCVGCASVEKNTPVTQAGAGLSAQEGAGTEQSAQAAAHDFWLQLPEKTDGFYAALTNWDGDKQKAGKTYVLDGINNGFMKSEDGRIQYYVYDQNLTEGGAASRDDLENQEKNPTKDDILIAQGEVTFSADYAWEHKLQLLDRVGGQFVTVVETDSTQAGTKDFDFQQILELGADDSNRLVIELQDGTYKAYGPFRHYSYTTIQAAEGQNEVIMMKSNMLNMKKGAYSIGPLFINTDDRDTDVKGYDGSYGFHLEGIQFRMDANRACIVEAAHASYYTVKNCRFDNGIRGHVIELTAMEDCVIENCDFINIDYDLDGKTRIGDSYSNWKFEVVQIEHDSSYLVEKENMSYIQGSTNWLTTVISHDNTYCQNIAVRNCRFDGVLRGVGGHVKYTTEKNKNITIQDNTFANVRDKALFLENYQNVLVKDNRFLTQGEDQTLIFLHNTVQKDGQEYTAECFAAENQDGNGEPISAASIHCSYAEIPVK